MQLGMIGMGKMGLPMVHNGRDHGLEIVVFSEKSEKITDLAAEGIKGFSRLETFVAALLPPRVVWLMIPAGAPVDTMISRLLPLLDSGDILIDGGNSWYQDSQRRHAQMLQAGIHFMDVGTSGGTEGARNGACLMIGGDREIYYRIEPVFKALSGSSGFAYLGESGSGHFVKMIHNGIEYGMMQAIGEGLEIMQHSPLGLELDKVTAVWQRGSIVSGLLMDMTAASLAREPDLQSIEGIVAASGEANWTVNEAVRLGVAAPTIAAALFARFKSQDREKFAERSVAAMRREFGGHAVVTRDKE
ncbi:MAG: decarboxylating 6-phosphogluconate dehydrogenase [Desulfobulbus sp.]|uniref:phosphogluconate dehydrogenase (NAD(+)-dependent, decarboxylating) n=1 Tax=uncultured Desulfobulbus sp. TaxID=239745 RepID=UPI001B4801CE|nr:decarboxylating 6-phosphogluconate dehydrogenase [uncultured Desulfobulbus sp.]MBP7517608.1 decarboxylating 6-phosphogluconate dehydrogenase [Desulfobulbus sp.]